MYQRIFQDISQTTDGIRVSSFIEYERENYSQTIERGKKNPDRSTESYPGERSSSTYLVLGACTRFHRNRGNSSRGRNSCPREFSARSSTSTRCPPRCPTCRMKKKKKKNSVSDQRDTRYILGFLHHFRHSLLLQLDVAPTPFHRGTWNTDGKTGHIDVHPPRHHERHPERYYSCWN